jgi:hypothetical protein
MNSYVGYVHSKVKAKHREVFLIFHCIEIIYPLNSNNNGTII